SHDFQGASQVTRSKAAIAKYKTRSSSRRKAVSDRDGRTTADIGDASVTTTSSLHHCGYTQKMNSVAAMHSVIEDRTVRIEVESGVTLAATLWRPVPVAERPTERFGCVIEYIPYRRDDGTAMRDAVRHPFFAAHGIAALRVDIRGSGDSDGLL